MQNLINLPNHLTNALHLTQPVKLVATQLIKGSYDNSSLTLLFMELPHQNEEDVKDIKLLVNTILNYLTQNRILNGKHQEYTKSDYQHTILDMDRPKGTVLQYINIIITDFTIQLTISSPEL